MAGFHQQVVLQCTECMWLNFVVFQNCVTLTLGNHNSNHIIRRNTFLCAFMAFIDFAPLAWTVTVYHACKIK